MKAEELIALATGRGIDLKAVAGRASKTEGLARMRTRTKAERLAGLQVTETAEGSESRVARAPRWSHAELGQAMSDLNRMPTLAAMYSFARDDKNFEELFRGLLLVAIHICRDEHWPMRVSQGDEPYAYLSRLTALVLDADRHQRYFTAAPLLYAAYMRASDDIWQVRLESKFLRLKGRYESWLDAARAHINRKLTEHFHAAEAAGVLDVEATLA